jgi:hypothetical protein
VLVNGRPAKAAAANFAQWQVVLRGADADVVKLIAASTDKAGNAEKTPHEILLRQKPAVARAE